MRKFLHFCILAMLSVAFPANAVQQTDYVESFETVDPGVPRFCPKGWEHHFYGTYYKATYTLEDNGSGGKYLSVTQYNPNIPAYDDFLVTPAVSGRVSLKVKSIAEGGSIKFYKVTVSDNGTITKGDEILPDVAPELGEEFAEVVFNDIAEPTRIGIRGHNVGFDDFSAQQADVVLKTKLALQSITLTASEPEVQTVSRKKYIDLTADNRYSLTFNVSLANTGETDFEVGAEGYSISLTAGGREIASQPIKSPLPVGESISEEYTFDGIDGTDFNGELTFYVKENISGSSDYETITVTTWHAEFVMRESETTSTWYDVKNGTTIDFGSSKEAVSERYWIYNNGTAPLSLEVSVPDGFGSSVVSGSVVDGGTHVPVDITMLADTYGSKSGTITFKGNDIADFSLQLCGRVLDPSLWFEGFEQNQLPGDMIAQGSGWTFKDGAVQISSGSENPRLVTPKLSLSEGETIEAKVKKYGSAYYKPVFKVFKSVDRKEWTEVTGWGEDDINTDWKSLEITGIGAGEWYLALECANIWLDELYGGRKAVVAHDLVVTGMDIPSEGEVNTGYTASVTVRNLGPELAASSYKAVLTVDGVDMACITDTPALLEGATATISLGFTPHATGENLPVSIKLVSVADGDLLAQTDDATLTITAEVMKSSITIGTQSGSTQNRAPVYAGSKFGWSDVIYSADKIGLDAGTQITRIAFKANNTRSGINGALKVWIENTAYMHPGGVTKWETPEIEPTVEMQWECPVVSGDEALVLDLSENPIVYTGQNLRIRVKSAMASTGSINWLVDNSAGKSKYDYESSDMPTPSMYDANTPVAFVSIAADPITVSGNVTDSTTGEPVADAKIVIKAGDVEYYATSGDNGGYEAMLLKAIDGYSINATAKGYFPYSAPLAADGTAIAHDIPLSQAKDLWIKHQTMPEKAVVNNPCTFRATVQNVNPTVFEDGSYSVSLNVGGETVATQDGVMLSGNTETLDNPDSEHVFEISFIPHVPTVDPVDAIITISRDGNCIFTGTKSPLTILEEVAEGVAVAGTPTGFDNKVPVYTYYDASMSQTVYPSRLLDIPSGADITTLTYKGYYTASKIFPSEIKVWMQNTADATDAQASFDTDGMTLVYEGTVDFSAAGSQSDPADLLSFELKSPFSYTGGNLRVIVKALTTNGSTVYFETDENETAYQKSAMTEAACMAANPTKVSMPVARMTYDAASHFTGKVTDAVSSDPIEGASVALASGDVLYSGQTDAAGEFHLKVVQKHLSYDLSVSAEGHKPHTASGIDLAQHHFIEMEQLTPSSVEMPEAATEPADDDSPVYNVYGQRVTRHHKGVLIQSGRKFINK